MKRSRLYYVIVPLAVVLMLVGLLILAPGSGEEEPFQYQFQ